MVVIALDFLSRHFSYSNTSCVLIKSWLICHLGGWVKHDFIDRLTCIRISYVRLVLPSALFSSSPDCARWKSYRRSAAIGVNGFHSHRWTGWAVAAPGLPKHHSCQKEIRHEYKLFRLSWQHSFQETVINGLGRQRIQGF